MGRFRLQSLYALSAASVALSKSAGSVERPTSIHFFTHAGNFAFCAAVNSVIL